MSHRFRHLNANISNDISLLGVSRGLPEVTHEVTQAMIVMLDAGAFRVMFKHLQLKGNTYYYRRRIPEDVRSLYKHLGRRADEHLLPFLARSRPIVIGCSMDGSSRVAVSRPTLAQCDAVGGAIHTINGVRGVTPQLRRPHQALAMRKPVEAFRSTA